MLKQSIIRLIKANYLILDTKGYYTKEIDKLLSNAWGDLNKAITLLTLFKRRLEEELGEGIMDQQTDLEKEVLKELKENRKKTENETTPEWELNQGVEEKPKRKPGRPAKRKDK